MLYKCMFIGIADVRMFAAISYSVNYIFRKDV